MTTMLMHDIIFTLHHSFLTNQVRRSQHQRQPVEDDTTSSMLMLNTSQNEQKK